MSTRRTVGDLGEFGLIAELTAGFAAGPGVLLGPGDDAAVLAAPDGRVVASTDLLAEGVHFRREWSSARDVGHKAAAANLADIAAMGAVPTALLVGLAVPPELPVDWALELTAGMTAEAAPVGATVVGGDVISCDRVVVAVTVLGDLRGGRALTRSGARPGDVVAVHGRLGWSVVGLTLLGTGRDDEHPEVVAAHRRPTPPYAAGPEAGALGATALIDVSDGLLSECGHLAAASEAAIDLERAALVPEPALQAAATTAKIDAVTAMLRGGEDHALLGTFPGASVLPAAWRVIGRVRSGEGVTVDGAEWNGAEGWTHF